MDPRPPLPPFTHDSAVRKVRLAEDAWNSRDPERVVGGYTRDSRWRNRDAFIQGHEEILAFLQDKWEREQDYRLVKEMWGFDGHRIAVRFQYEWRHADGRWFRAHGNEQWAFSDDGLMYRRDASINDVAMAESERRFHWPAGARPADYPGLSEMGL